ncbi:hypothetical protein PR202_ga14473 [Eleusine coracana subsp. coracana]|uniref:Uncharacterized protein n=1 Tax=Eleusine coracana subsp. coracana TaxID=191504 RepID=A0AAV5CHI2_ELECO|nr:hypothetical protein PR202_ga14473 [Eleusine coracana subsp. coracana]
MGCAFSSSGPGGSLPPFSGVRVIHTNGYVEDFPGPGVVTVAHVTGGKSSSPPRYSVFQSESSAVDLACLMNRLTALARKSSCAANAATQGPTSAVEALFHAAAQAQGQRQNAAPLAQQGAKVSSPARAKPWRPRLDRIDESFGRSSMRSSSCSEA